MDERAIIIADKDAEYRRRIAEHFTKAGYRVETTDSAAHVLCSILEKQTPVLLLGNDFDKKVSSVDLIHLLKKCNRHLNVIMVSDELPPAQVRRIREEGVFYHALKPSGPEDHEELGQAVQCAFEKEEVEQKPPEPVRRSEPGLADDETGFDRVHSARGTMQALTWVVCLVAVIFGASYLSLIAAETTERGSVTFWTFLAFCTLIVVTQFLPVFRIRLPESWRREHTAKGDNTSLDEK